MSQEVRAIRHETGTTREGRESLALEAPLQIKVNGESFTVTMRTPGADEALVRGLLFTEGIVPQPDADLRFTAIPDPETGHTACIEVTVPEEALAKPVEGRRTLFASASCGVCGTREPADIQIFGPPIAVPKDVQLNLELIPSMQQEMQGQQQLFRETGGVHAAALSDAAGTLLACFEDVGRHNALDKAIGHVLEQRQLSRAIYAFVSGRVSYEFVYKAYRAGIPFILAVSAPSSMAVETADRLGMTVVGFCRDGRATVYGRFSHGTDPAPE